MRGRPRSASAPEGRRCGGYDGAPATVTGLALSRPHTRMPRAGRRDGASVVAGAERHASAIEPNALGLRLEQEEDEQDDGPDDRDPSDEPPAARAVGVVEPAPREGQPRDERREAPEHGREVRDAPD